MITILLPVHNDGKYLKYCLDSIKEQSHPDFLCLVGFNGTEDDSKDIFKKTVGKDPRFLDLDYGRESGKSITLNKMLEEVKTEITCLMDGDDAWHREKLDRQMRLLGKADVIGTLTTYIDARNFPGHRLQLSEYSEDISRLMLSGHNHIVNSSCFVKTKCFQEIGGWDPAVEGLEDYDVWVKLALLGKSFYNIQEELTYHRIHSGSNFNSRTLKYLPVDILERNTTQDK
jgi:glycosyltransferase involved in cell wall biosynthesis